MPLAVAVRHPDEHDQVLDLPPGPLSLGRDADSDVVLADPRCSRHHAVIETGPDEIAIRDVGSANGVFLNGRRIERAQLAPGDRLRLGRTWIEVLASRDTPAWLDGPPEPGDVPTPPTLTLLAALWATPTPVTLGIAILAVLTGHLGRNTLPTVLLAAVIVLPFSLLMMVGLSTGRPWAYRAQLVVAALGILTCVLTPLSLVVIAYLLHPGLRRRFGDEVDQPVAASSQAASQETVFVMSLTGGIVFAGALAGILAGMGQRGPAEGVRLTGNEQRAVTQLVAMRSAQESFRRVCNVGYADLDGLRRPASVIPGYPKAGPVFLSARRAPDTAHGYLFALSVHDALPLASDCPVSRRFRGYSYAATPENAAGRHFLLESPGTIRAATGRPATHADPPLTLQVR